MSDLIKLLEKSSLGIDSEGATVDDICAATGRSKSWIREKLVEINREGRLIVGRKFCTDITGRKVNVPTYRVKGSADRLNSRNERTNRDARRGRPPRTANRAAVPAR